MSTIRCSAVVVALAFLFGATGEADEKEKAAKAPVGERAARNWMQLKLDYSQKILAGIAVADFDGIVQSAQAMKGLTSVEGFIRGRTPGYEAELKNFRDANDELIKQAKKDSVEGATLAFTQMTFSCVSCHKKLRENTSAKTQSDR